MAVRYWISGGTGAWNSTTNWAASSGGASGATVPASTDSVVFDSNSGTGNITIVAATTVAAVTITDCSALTIISGATYAFVCSGAFTYNGGTFTFGHAGATTLSSTLIVNSAAASGVLTFGNAGAVSVAGTLTFSATGAEVSFNNTTSVSLAAVTVNGSAGYLTFYNSTTVTLTGALSVTTTGVGILFQNSTNITFSTVAVNATSSGGAITFTNSGTITATSLTYSVTSSPGTTLYFGVAVTTITLSGANGLNIYSPLYGSNVSFECATLSLTGSGIIRADPAAFYCDVSIAGTGYKLYTDFTLAQTTVTIGGSGLTLNGFIIKAGAASVNGPVVWDKNTRSNFVLVHSLSLANILTTGASFTKTISGGNAGYFELRTGTSGYGDTAYLTTNSAGDYPNIKVIEDTYYMFPTQLAASGTSTLYLGKVFFDSTFIQTFTTYALYIDGDLTFNSGMTFVCNTSLNFVGTTTFINAGISTSCPVYIGTSSVAGSLTLTDNFNTTGMLWLANGTLNLADYNFTCSKLKQYAYTAGVVVAITINGGTGQSGTITVRSLGTQVTSPAQDATVQSLYTGGGSTYTITNNPTIIIEPTNGGGNGQLYLYNDNIQGNYILKPALNGVAWNFTTGQYSATKVMFTNFTIADGFSGTVSTLPYEIYGNLYIGNNVTLSSHNTNGFNMITPTATTKTIYVSSTASLQRPIEISGVSATAITQLLTDVSINKTLTLTTGKLDLNDYTFTITAFDGSVTGIRSIGFGTSGKIVTTGTGTVWNAVATISYTGTSRVEINNATATAATVTTGTNTETNALNFYIKSGTYSLSISGTVRDIDFTGYSGTLASTGSDFTMYGNLTFSSGMTITFADARLLFSGTTGTQYITTNNVLIKRSLLFNGSGTYVLQDSFTQFDGAYSSPSISYNKGTWDLNGKTLTTPTFQSVGALTRTLIFNGARIYITGSGSQAFYTNSVFTTSAGIAPGFIYMTSSTAKTFANASGAQCVYNATLVQAGSGLLSITGTTGTGNSTFTNLKNSVVPANITVTSGITLTFTDNFQLLGTASALVTLNATVNGTAANVSLSTGNVSCDYLSLRDSHAIGGATWNAGNHSVNVSNNTGWYFTAAYTANPNMLMLFPL